MAVSGWNPRLAERLAITYRLARAPASPEDFVDLWLSRMRSEPQLLEFLRKVRAGTAVIGWTAAARGQAVVLPEGREAKVMCSYDAIMTALLRGRGLVRASCPHCGLRTEVAIEDGRVVRASSPSIVFWLGDGPRGIPICDHLNLFPDRDHLSEWVRGNPDELGVPLPLEDAVGLLARMERGV